MAATAPTGIARFIPGLHVLRTYQRSWLKTDLVAGLVVTALLVPQGMAYAELAGLPPVTGLYTTVLALLAYAVFGPSRVLVLGPDSSLGPMIAATILPLLGADGDPARAVALASMLAIMMGLICVAAGLGHLGAVTQLLSKPVRIGYLNGLAVIVLVGQLPKLFGFSTDADTFLGEVRAFVEGLLDGLTNPTALAIGLASLAVILVLKRLTPRVPGVLVAVVGATVVTAVWGLAESRGISVVGSIPQGFPTPSLPRVGFDDLPLLFGAAVGMAFVTLADASALSRSFALKYNDDVDPNQEIIGLGTANIAAGFFQGFPVSASSSRTAVADSAGGRSQLVGVVGAVAIVVLLLFANDLVADLPSAALAAVVIAASLGLADVPATRALWRMRKTELFLSVAAALGVVLVGVLQGIVIAVLLSLGAYLRRTWRPYTAELGIDPDRKGFHDISRDDDRRAPDGVLIYRFDAAIYFANAEWFADQVKQKAAARQAQVVIIAAEPVTDVDTTGAESLTDLLGDLQAEGVTLMFAELRGPVADRLRRYGLYDEIGDDHFFGTVEEAVAAAEAIVATHPRQGGPPGTAATQ